MISIVSPVYRAAKILPVLVQEIEAVMRKMGQDFEIILVDDRSPDDSWDVMKELSLVHKNLYIYRLSRNFGQHATIMAGLSKTNGEWVVVMDCDMQDQPKEIEKLYLKAMEGYDIVQASRFSRKDTFSKKISSSIFHLTFNFFAGIAKGKDITNYGIYKRKVIQSVLSINDNIKSFPLFVNWVGYNSVQIPVEHASRIEGASSYNFRKLFSLASNVIISFSDKPLKIFGLVGVFITAMSFIIFIFFFISFLVGAITEPGFASLILSIWFVGGITITSISIAGLYISKTFNQVKGRPIYLIDEEHE